MLHNKTIHYGFAISVPLENVGSEQIMALEKAIHGTSGNEVVGRDTPKKDVHELKCKDADDTFYKLRIMKSGEVQSAVREPIYSISVIMGEDGNHTKMNNLYLNCIDKTYKTLSGHRFVIFKEATIRTIWGTTEIPAFQFLWEKILNQKPEKITAFGKPLLGGGLRLNVAPHPIMNELNEPTNEVVQAEYHIESYFKDPRYIFVEGKYLCGNPIQYNSIKALKDAVSLNIEHVINHTESASEKFLEG